MSPTRAYSRRATMWTFPQAFMRALRGLYEGHRAIADGTTVSAFWASGTIIPGCSCATTMAKVLLISAHEADLGQLPLTTNQESGG
eukprot:3571187-Heterocapsa_arctica.AAC.1